MAKLALLNVKLPLLTPGSTSRLMPSLPRHTFELLPAQTRRTGQPRDTMLILTTLFHLLLLPSTARACARGRIC